MNKFRTLTLSLLTCTFAFAGIAQSDADNKSSSDLNAVLVKAGTVHIGNGETIENGMVLLVDGTISAVGSDLSAPDDARIINMPDGSITPGLIDANALLEPADAVSSPERRRRGVVGYFLHNGHQGPSDQQCFTCDGRLVCAYSDTHKDLKPDEVCPVCGGTSDNMIEHFASGLASNQSRTEASSEIVPHTLMIDAINLRSPDFDRLVRGGVTTVFASPDSAAVIGPRGAIVKTAGKMSDRILKESSAAQATIGMDPYIVGAGNQTPRGNFVTTRTRRPNSRMGVVWVFRKAFFDAADLAAGNEIEGADQASPEALAYVNDIRDGKLDLRVQARTQRDILTTMRLADEFGLKFTLLEATEAYECLEELQNESTPVVFGPIYDEPSSIRSFSPETQDSKLATFRALIDANIDTALSARDLREEDGLARQAMYAIRSGVSIEDALKSVTSTPARMLGIDDRVGTLEVDKQADVIVWTGQPFAATSQPAVVIINGEVAYEN